jgi:hypothetical protein
VVGTRPIQRCSLTPFRAIGYTSDVAPPSPRTVAELLARSLPPRTALELAATLAESPPAVDLEQLLVTTEGTLHGGEPAPAVTPQEWSGEVGVVLIGCLRGRQVVGRTATSRVAVARDSAWELEQSGRISPRITAAISAAVRMPEETRALPKDLAGALREIAEHASGPTLRSYMALENQEDVATDSFAPITWDDQEGPADPATGRIHLESPRRYWPVAVAVGLILLVIVVVVVTKTMS